MHLLTWHGTLVHLRGEGGGLIHCPLGERPQDAAPLALEVPTELAEAARVRTALGTLLVSAAPDSRGIRLSRFGQFLSAEASRPDVAFDRAGADLWETFLPISERDLADLRHVLAHGWIEAGTRAFIPQREVRMAGEFRLLVGRLSVDLAAGLPLGAAAADSGAYKPPDAFRLAGRDLVLARQRGSALVTTPAWPVRARQAAETMALAAYRELRGAEPEQYDLDRDVTYLLDNGGPGGLGGLLHRLRHDPAAPPDGSSGLGGLPLAALACPAVSLGIGCISAWVLKRMGAAALPMPFDWLQAEPAMVRHMLETDFAVLLDQSQYESLSGVPGETGPAEGCAHRYYAEHFGVRRVFNHSDPTQEAAYCYVQAGVNRFRDLLASREPKLFLQVHHTVPDAAESFAETAALLDRLTTGAILLQVTVLLPDRRLRVPMLSLTEARGLHRRYIMQPTSQMLISGFNEPIDENYLAWVVAAHAGRSALALEATARDRNTLAKAVTQFGDRRPDTDQAGAGGLPVTVAGNASLAIAARMIGLPDRFRFESYDRQGTGVDLSREAVLVEATADLVTMKIEPVARHPWMLMQRSLTLIFLLDAMQARSPLSAFRFVAELGDAGTRDDSLSFCSNRVKSFLVPDPAFIGTGGYEDERHLAAKRTPAWTDRRQVVFWRGSTTGRARRVPPPAGEPDDFTWLPRLDLCHRARLSAAPNNFDFGISEIVQIDKDPEIVMRIKAADLLRPRAARTDFLECRAILVIDGNTNAWSAMFCALLSGACVVKVESEHGYRQWYYDRLKPWIHFVPMSADLSDMDDIAAWVLSHDDDARAIGAAGRALAESMTFESEVELAAGRLGEWVSEKGKEGLLF